MIVWINGPFGGGKSTTAKRVVERLDGCRLFDPEWVGYLLREHLRDQATEDFQDLPSWRRLVPTVASELHRATGDTLLATQSVQHPGFWNELATGLEAVGIPLVHIVLDMEERALRERIDRDDVELGAAEWRHAHVSEFLAARRWMLSAADLVIDTTNLEPIEVADRVAMMIIERRGALSSD